MSKKETITVLGTEIILFSHKKEDYVSLTDMAKHKNAEATGYVISRWLSARYSIDFVGIGKRINNPDFNVVEFNNIKNESGTNGFILNPSNSRGFRQQVVITQMRSLAGYTNLKRLQ